MPAILMGRKGKLFINDFSALPQSSVEPPSLVSASWPCWVTTSRSALTPCAQGEGAKAAEAARGLSLPHRREAGLSEILLIILSQKEPRLSVF